MFTPDDHGGPEAVTNAYDGVGHGNGLERLTGAHCTNKYDRYTTARNSYCGLACPIAASMLSQGTRR